MRQTVDFPVSSRDVLRDEQVREWVNREALPVLRQARAALNVESVTGYVLASTGSAAFERIWTSDAVPVNSVWLVECRVTGRNATDRAAYVLRGLFFNEGTVTQQGATQVDYSEESSGGLDARLVVDGSRVAADVRDAGAAMDFTAVVRVLEETAA